MKRLVSVLVSLLLLASFFVGPTTAVAADEKEYVILAGSDFQTDNFSTKNVEKVLDTLEMHGITSADHVFFCGDYTLQKMETQTSEYGIKALKQVFSPIVGTKMIFVQGNHDHEDTIGLAQAGNNDPSHGGYGVFVIREDQYREWGNDRSVTEAVAAELRTYLENKVTSGWDKPVFVLCHIPLHWSNRTIKDGSGTDADVLFDVLEEYGKKGMNLFYLYGHNHSGGYDDFMGGGAVYLKKGDTMEVCHGDKRKHETRTLSFTYMNAGFIGYYSTSEAVDAGITMSVFRVKGNEVIVTRYDSNFNLTDGRYGIHNLKSKGILHPDYSEEGYHAVPDTREYASSRKVTATDDVYLAPVIPEFSTTTTTTITWGTTAPQQTVLITKTSKESESTTIGSVTTTTDESQNTTQTTAETEGEATVTESVSDHTEETTTTTTEPVSAEQEKAATPWWVWLCVGGAVLAVGAIVVLIVLLLPKKAK